MKFENSVCFDDVLLTPQYSNIDSRKKVDISSFLGEYKFGLPIISSPMDTVTEYEMAIAMAEPGGLGMIHRYNKIEDQTFHAQRALMDPATVDVGAAIGVTGDYEERACALWDAGVKILCLDVAHGHHILVKNAIERLKGIFGDKIHLMAGNVATLEAFNDLADWGADSIRVGVGGGSICSTRVNTGHGVPTFQSIEHCSYSDRNVTLIADGGIKNSGDIVKALAAGADFVMLGSMLAGTDETPGQMFVSERKKYKVYRGMASRDAQVAWRGHSSSPEGISTTIPYKGPVGDILKDVGGNVKSGFSYSGAHNLEELQAKAKFILQTQASQRESATHILYRQ